MKTIIIILLFVFFTCGPFYLLISRGVEKLEEKGHGGCIIAIIVVLFVTFSLIGLVGSIKSCSQSDHYPSYDYYDDRTPR